MDTIKDTILSVPGKYPGALIGLVIVMILVIAYLLYTRGAGKEKATATKKKKSSSGPGSDEETVDDLIEEIHKKQKNSK